MKTSVVVFSLIAGTSIFGTSAFAQGLSRSLGGVVFPGGGGSAGVTRGFGGVVYPGGTPPNLTVPRPATAPRNTGIRNTGNGNYRRNSTVRSYVTPTYVAAYPVYVGGYDNGYAAQEPAPAQRANPVMLQAGPDGDFTSVPQNPNPPIYEQRPQGQIMAAPEEPAAPEAPRYLLAFKDHTVYSAVAYWADGDTLHYFTNGNTHNQASLSLLDRPLTERLNKELGIDFSLPPAPEK
jgi:hypothetical protein